MKQLRRTFLEMFGITGAAFAGGTKVDVFEDRTIKPLPGAALVSSIAKPWLAVQRGQLYSAIDLNPNAETLSHHPAFHYGLGQIDPCSNIYGATNAETNMCMASCLPAPEVFCVQRVGVIFSPSCDPKERSRFIEIHAFEVWICDKVYWRSPLADIFAVADLGSESYPRFPVKAMADLAPVPLILESQMYFKAILSGRSFKPESYLRLWVVYDGLHARGVQ